MEQKRMHVNTEVRVKDRLGRAAGIAILLALASVGLLLTVSAVSADQSFQQVVADGWHGYEEQPLRVNVWHDRDDDEPYRKGESVRVHFEANHDAYAVVYRVDAEGEVSVLWPRSRYDDGFIFGLHTYNVPTSGAARLRASGVEGVEYVQVLVSAYPFDLRDLDIDFHHEREDVRRAYYVAGDPFLAMNDVNYEVTGLEDAEDFVVANYTSWYVGRRVDHPRYLCGQCHEDDPAPYRDTCVVEIHHDHGWGNDWYVDYGYYPVYHYPVYYYVDPWTWRPWVNYWYRPWYVWPRHRLAWGFDCYAWNYSPYWTGDVWARYKQGDRLHRPLGKGARYKNLPGDAPVRHPRSLGKDPRPDRGMLAALDDRGPVGKTRVGAPGAKPAAKTFKDVPRSKRGPQTFAKPRQDGRARGLQVSPERYPATIGTGSVSRGESEAGIRHKAGTGRVSAGKGGRTVSPESRRESTDRSVVRPVEPRSKGQRIWQGGRTGGGTSRSLEPAQRSGSTERPSRAVKPKTRSGSSKSPSRAVKPKTRSGSSKSPSRAVNPKPRSSSSKKTGKAVKPSSRSGSSKSTNRAVKPRSGSSRQSTPKATPRSSGSSSSRSRSSGSSKSGGSSKNTGSGKGR